jgi:hypothetical protein
MLMLSRLIKRSFVVLIAAAALRPLMAQQAAASTPSVHRGAVAGAVTDSSLRPITGAELSIVGTSLQVVTRDNGRFQILGLPVGAFVLSVKHVGYRSASVPIEIDDRDTMRVAIMLERVAVGLDTVHVTQRNLSAKLAGFEDRRARGEGHFVTAAEIEQRGSPYITELLRNIPGVSIRPSHTGGSSKYFAASGRFGTMAAGPLGKAFKDTLLVNCWMQVVVDGVNLPPPTDLDVLPSPKEVAGIEVYSGPATMPREFLGMIHTTCGVIFIWTKDGSS